jgi:hypothetical protein
MLLEELFNNDAKVLEVLSKLTPEDIGEYVAESVLLEELCQEGFSDPNLFKGGRTVQGDDSASKGDSAGDSALATAGDLAKTIATGGSATANLAAARAAKKVLQKTRAKRWLNKSTSSSTPPTNRTKLKKQVKIDAKAIGSDAGADAKDKNSKVRKDNNKKNAIKSAPGDAERRARESARKTIADYNKANPNKQLGKKTQEKLIDKAGKIGSRIAARHATATLLGAGTPISWLLNLGALGWDAYDIAKWYLNNKK